MTEKRLKRHYDKEFKKQAVSLLVRSKKPTTVIAQELGIGESLLRKWRIKYFKYVDENFGNSEKDNEIIKLKKELSETRLERDILKKALSIFSKEKP